MYCFNMNTSLSYVSLGSSLPVPSRNPEVANIFPGFPSGSVKQRPERTTGDFTATGSNGNDRQSSNTPSGVIGKGLFISCKVLTHLLGTKRYIDSYALLAVMLIKEGINLSQSLSLILLLLAKISTFVLISWGILYHQEIPK